MDDTASGAGDVIITHRLSERPLRSPDHAAENRALDELAKELAEHPENLLQKLAETIVELGIGDSAGVSIEEMGEVRQFRWVALAGAWSQLRGGTIPFDASPCGLAVQRDRLLLIESPERFFAAAQVEPLIHEGLLVPFHVKGTPVGTLWINLHSPNRTFDLEDARLLQSLARFASAAHQMVLALGSSEAGRLASDTRLRALAHASSDVFYVMSSDMRELRELSGGSFIADTTSPSRDWLEDYIPAEDHERTLVAMSKAIRAKTVFELEHRVRRLNGDVGWAMSRAVPILNADGEIAEWFGAASDITARKSAEAALRESEQRFRTLAESIEDVFYITDLDRNALVYLSPAYERIWGRPASELLADLGRFLDTLHPDDRSGFFDGKAAQERGEPVTIEYRVLRPDGAVRWILDRSFPILGEAGRLSAGVASDVTNRKEVEHRLRASEERFRQFADAAPEVVWMREAETLQWEFLSPAFEAIYGLSCKEALKGDNLHRWAELIVPEDRQRALQSIDRVRAGEQVTFEYRVRRPSDGTLRWLRNTDFPIRDAAGRVQRIGGFGQDVTAMKRVDERLRESERRQRALVEGIPQLVWRAVDGGRWTWSSPQWSAYTGLSEEASRDHGWLDALHEDDRNGAMRAWHEAERSGSFDAEYRVRHDGEERYRWFSTRASAVRNEAGGVIEWLGTSTDVDELRRLQNEQQVLVAELQHRTRNLIAVVRSISQQTMAAATSLDEFQTQFNDRLGALSRVQGLLSRATDDRITIGALLNMELNALGAQSLRDRIVLDGPEVPLRNSVVQTLALALHELTTNARKYGALATGAGQLRVTWRVQDVNGEGQRLSLDWVEEGTDMLHEQTGRGYGRELIERALPYALGAKTMFRLDEGGVRCSIDLPLNKPTNRRRHL